MERFWLLTFHLKSFKKHQTLRVPAAYLQNFVDVRNEEKQLQRFDVSCTFFVSFPCLSISIFLHCASDSEYFKSWNLL